MQARALLVVGSVGQKTGKRRSGGDENQTKVKSSDLGKVSVESGGNKTKKGKRGLKVSAVSALFLPVKEKIERAVLVLPHLLLLLPQPLSPVF